MFLPFIPYIFPFLRFNLSLSLLQNQLLPLHPLPHIRHILHHRFEVGSGVVRFGDEHVVRRTVGGGSVKRGDGDESAEGEGV